MTVIKKYKQAYEKQFNQEMLWDVAIRYKKDNSAWQMVKMKSNNFWAADPFIFEKDNKVYLFYERYDRSRNLGELAVSVIDSNLEASEEICIISRPYHLSFPNVFEYKDNYYLIPESQSNHTIEIYRADCFPYSWKLYKTIKNNVEAVDTIIWNQNASEIELHTSIVAEDSCNVENWIIRLDSDFNILEEIKMKKCSDYGNRNAGKLITKGDTVFRIGQDCRNGEYGSGLVIYKVSPHGCFEEEVDYWGLEHFKINNSDYSGIHTYNASASIEVIDLRYLRNRNLVEKIHFILKLGDNYVRRRLHR